MNTRAIGLAALTTLVAFVLLCTIEGVYIILYAPQPLTAQLAWKFVTSLAPAALICGFLVLLTSRKKQM